MCITCIVTIIVITINIIGIWPVIGIYVIVKMIMIQVSCIIISSNHQCWTNCW